MPGKFKINVLLILPKIVGFPGFMSIPLIIVSKFSCKKDSFVKSASPTETPPEVIIKSASKEFKINSFIDSILSCA